MVKRTVKKLLDLCRERGWAKENEEKNTELFCKSYYGTHRTETSRKVIKKTQ